MDKIFAVFQLKCAKERVVGRVDWVYRLNIAQTFNNRINRNKAITIFWSKDLKKNPIFKLSSNLQFKHSFDPDVDAIYRAKIIKCFGMFFLFYVDNNFSIEMQ